MRCPKCDRRMDEGEFQVNDSLFGLFMTGGISRASLKFKSEEWKGNVYSSRERPRQGHFCIDCGTIVILNHPGTL